MRKGRGETDGKGSLNADPDETQYTAKGAHCMNPTPVIKHFMHLIEDALKTNQKGVCCCKKCEKYEKMLEMWENAEKSGKYGK